MKTYQTLLDAIAYAELAGATFKNVAYRQDDVINVNSQSIPTMAKRITDELEALIPELKGEDGVSITDVYIDGRNVYVVSDDGNTTTFTDIVPEDAISIDDFSVDNDSQLVQTTSDGNTLTVGQIEPEEAKGLTNLEVLGTGFIRLTYSDGSTEEVGKIDNFGGVPITDSDVVNDRLYITLGGDNTIDLGNVKGEIGSPGSIFTSVEQVRTGDDTFYFDFELETGATFRVGPAKIDRRIAIPDDVLRKEFDEETGQLQLFPAGVPSIDLGNMHGVDGIDAEDAITVSTINLNSQGSELSTSLSDGTDIVFDVPPKQIIIPAGETEIISYNITANKELVFELGIPNSEPVKINVGKVRGTNGLNIDDVTILSNGDIEVTKNDDGDITKTVIGNVNYEEIEKAEVLPTRELQFTTKKGNVIIAEGSPDGDNGAAGAFIQSLDYDTENEGMVSVILSNGTIISDLGKARPFKSHTVSRNQSDEIIVTFDDGSTTNLGVIDGADARNASSISVDSSGIVSVTFDDGSDIQTVNSINQPLSTIEYEKINNRLVFDYNGYDKKVRYNIPEDGEHGVWLTELRELSNGRVRAYFSDGTARTLPGGTIHSIWPTQVTFPAPNTTEKNDVEILWKWNETSIGTAGVVNLGTIDHFYADHGDFIIDGGYELNGDLVLEWNDSTISDTVIENLRPVWVEDIYLEGDTFFAKYNHLEDPQEIDTIVDFNGRNGLWVTDMRVNALTGDFSIVYSDESEVNMGSIDGVEGNWFTNIERDENNNLITTNRFGNVVNEGDFSSLDGLRPKWVTNASITSDRRLDVTFNDGTNKILTYVDGEDSLIPETLEITVDRDLLLTYVDGSTVDLGNVDGTDGKILTNLVRTENGQLVSSFHLSEDENYGNIDGVDFTSEIVNITLSNDKLITQVTNGSTTETDVVVRRITDASTVDDILSLETNYTTEPLLVGNTAGLDVDDGRYIINFEVINQELMATYSDATGVAVKVSDFSRVDFDNAQLVNGVDDEQENLKIVLTDNTEFDLGRVKGIGESINIVDALINQDGQLVLTYSNDTIYRSDSRVMGEHGADISNSFIDENGYLIFSKSDQSTIQAGFVLQDLGFAPFDFTRTYDRGESATNDGNIYVALDDGVESVPTPDNSQWARVRLEGDGNSPDASRPELISPKNGEVHSLQQPYLLGGDLRNYYSVDTRSNRIFQIDLAENTFLNPIYVAEENLNGHQVNMTLDVGTEYKWRCRDVVKETGYITDWSLEGTFTVVANAIQRPVTMFGGGLNGTDMPAMPTFMSSSFNGTGTHSETTWQIKRNSDDSIVYDVKSNDLLSTLIPFGILVESEEYSVRCKHHSTTDESPFSEWLSFSTEVKFTIDFTPVVSFVGDDVNATIAKPYFKSNSFLDEFYENYMDGTDLIAIWEVRNSSDVVVWTTQNQYDILTVQVSDVMESGQTYTIRVKYESPRFFGESNWSNSVSFTPDWFIATPTVTTPYDVIDYPVDGLFESTEFSGTNEEHFGSLWEVRKSSDDSVAHSSYRSFTNKLEWAVSFGENDSQEEYYVVLKHLGRYGESEWSEPLLITMQEIININVYVTSGDNTVRRLSNDGALVWLYEEHSSATRNVAVDDLRNAYSVGNDSTVRKIDEFGREVWVFNHDAIILSVAVDSDDYSVYFGDVNGLIVKLDSDANELWRYTGHTDDVNALAIDPEQNLYTASRDRSVRKISKDGVQIWSFTGHTNIVRGVSVDVNGEVYTASDDRTVRKINSRGGQVWSFTGHTSTVYDVSVNTNFEIFTVSQDRTVRRIDQAGTEVWSLNLGTTLQAVDSDYLNRSYVGGDDGVVRMISEGGDEIWSYLVNSSVNITDITVNQIPVLFKPIELKGRYWLLKPPNNLVAI